MGWVEQLLVVGISTTGRSSAGADNVMDSLPIVYCIPPSAWNTKHYTCMDCPTDRVKLRDGIYRVCDDEDGKKDPLHTHEAHPHESEEVCYAVECECRGGLQVLNKKVSCTPCDETSRTTVPCKE